MKNEGIYTRDASKPDGEACNADNTLKDASEIEWFHSPSQITATWSTQKRVRGDNEESTNEDDTDELPKPKRKVNAEYFRARSATNCGQNDKNFCRIQTPLNPTTIFGRFNFAWPEERPSI